MAVIGEDELRQRAETFREELRNAGIDAEILEDSFRDYSVKLGLSSGGESLGKWIIYYKAKLQTFSEGTGEIRAKDRLPELERCWYGSRCGSQSNRDTVGNLSVENLRAGECMATAYVVYIDGSAVNGTVTYAYLVLFGGSIIHEDAGIVPDDYATANQVGGEIYAVLEAVRWCGTKGVESLTINYDFANLEHWYTGKFRAKNQMSRHFVEELAQSHVQIQWRKVLAHSGDRWNERVDRLAKQAATQTLSPSENALDADLVSTSSADGLRAELESVLGAFQQLASVRGVNIRFLGVINQNFGRLEICNDGQRVGLFDVYNTIHKRLSPKVVQCHPSPLNEQVLDLWSEFRRSSANTAACGVESTVCAQQSDLVSANRLDFVYGILQEYRHLSFDFIALAEELVTAYRDRGLSLPFSAEDARLNFGMLTVAYHALQEQEP